MLNFDPEVRMQLSIPFASGGKYPCSTSLEHTENNAITGLGGFFILMPSELSNPAE